LLDPPSFHKIFSIPHPCRRYLLTASPASTLLAVSASCFRLIPIRLDSPALQQARTCQQEHSFWLSLIQPRLSVCSRLHQDCQTALKQRSSIKIARDDGSEMNKRQSEMWAEITERKLGKELTGNPNINPPSRRRKGLTPRISGRVDVDRLCQSKSFEICIPRSTACVCWASSYVQCVVCNRASSTSRGNSISTKSFAGYK
jgi:hypothetical protein